MRIKFQQANRNLYGATNVGMLRIEDHNSSYRLAGMIKPIEPEIRLSVVPGTSPGIDLAFNQFLGYRVFYGYYDSHNNLYLSEPSDIVTQKSTTVGTNRFVANIKVRSGTGLTSNHFYRIYRTNVSAPGVDPGDEMRLVYEKSWTIPELTAGFSTVVDFSSDLLLGQPAYTNETSEGIQYANGRPPLAGSISWYKNHMFFFNTKRQQTLSIRIIGSEFTVGERISINGLTYQVQTTAETNINNVQEGVSPAGENAATGTFVNYTSVLGVSTRIEGIARSLVRVINANPLNKTIYAYYSSAAGGVPGIITLIERGIGGPRFDIKALNVNIRLNFEPILKYFPTDADVISTNRQIKNGGHISKPNQPEHVPNDVTNFFIGDDNNQILVTHVVKDGIIMLRNTGVAVCTGDSLETFSFREIDTTINFTGISQASSVLNNRVYAYSTQGVLEITVNGVSPVSTQENSNLTVPVINSLFSDNDNNGFIAVGSEDQKTFVMCIADTELYNQNASGEKVCGERNIFSTFAYDYTNNTWTRWLINANCFAIHNGLIYYGLNTDYGLTNKRILRQRVTNEEPDIFFPYFDEGGTLVIDSVDTVNSTITVVGANIAFECPDISTYMSSFRNYARISGNIPVGYLHKGMLIHKSGNFNRYLVLEVQTTTPHKYKLNTVAGLTAGDTVKFFRQIFTYIGFGPFCGSSPQIIKKYNTLSVIGDMSNVYEMGFDFFNSNDNKAYPYTYPYYYTALNTNLGEAIQSKSEIVYDPLIKTSIQIDPLNRQRFFERFLRIGVPPNKNNSPALYVGIYNNFAGSFLAMKSIGFEMTSEDTIKSL